MTSRIFAKIVFVFYLCVLPGSFAVAQPTNSLPHIRVAADGRHLETERGQPFVPFGVSYYRPGQGWAPQLWKKFDAEATRRDFAKMKAQGVNCARVFLSFGSFLMETNQVSAEGFAKFDQFLQIAEDAGIYVHPTGPDRWEGSPAWASGDIVGDETVLRALEVFWKQFAARYRGRSVIYAYDLRNEPEVAWADPSSHDKWILWLTKKYGENPIDSKKLATAWGGTNIEVITFPEQRDCPNCGQMLDYQQFRESIADEWTSRQVAAIKSVDPLALVTVGSIQWSVPSVLPGSWHYSAFRPERQARLLDFLTIHFYPLAAGHYDYQGDDEAKNLAYLESVVREMARWKKPVVIGEFGWYGGGTLNYGKHPMATEDQQAEWCRKLVESTAGMACGWLNWGFYDQPEAGDVSQLTGLMKANGDEKAWGREFKLLSERYANRKLSLAKIGPRPPLDWDGCLTSDAKRSEFDASYLKAWKAAH